jgi:hypothetical protein
MKVMCIDDTMQRRPILKYGEIYTVYDEDNTTYNLPAVFLEEIDQRLGGKRPWDKNRFIPLSNIDETTFERNYNTPIYMKNISNDTLVKSALLTALILLIVLLFGLSACTTSRCGNWKDVQRHDRKPFRASINSGSSSNPNIIRANKN